MRAAINVLWPNKALSLIHKRCYVCVCVSWGSSMKKGARNDVCEQARKLRAGGFEPAVFGALNLALFTQDKIPTAIKGRKSPRQARGLSAPIIISERSFLRARCEYLHRIARQYMEPLAQFAPNGDLRVARKVTKGLQLRVN